jgi:hypothetical protein
VLSLLFMSRAFVDSLYAWDLFQASLESPYMDLILITVTEVTPCMLISQIMKKRKPKGAESGKDGGSSTTVIAQGSQALIPFECIIEKNKSKKLYLSAEDKFKEDRENEGEKASIALIKTALSTKGLSFRHKSVKNG